MLKLRSKITAVAAGAAGALSLLAFAAGPAMAGNGPAVRYEVDNGTTWTLTKTPARTVAPAANFGYADAGVVVDLGETGGSFNGLSWTGSGDLHANLWFTSGADEASIPGTHNLSDPVDFSYGFDNGDGTVYMASGPYAGQTLNFSQIRSDFSGSEVLAWVGIVYTGGNTVRGSVTSVNGTSIGNRKASVTVSNGELAAAVN